MAKSRTSSAARAVLEDRPQAASPPDMAAMFAMFTQFMAAQGAAPAAPQGPIDPLTQQPWQQRQTAPLQATATERGNGKPTVHKITPTLQTVVDHNEFPACRPNGEEIKCPPAIRALFMRHMSTEWEVVLRNPATGDEIELGAVEPRKFKEGNHGLGGQADAWVEDTQGNSYRVKGYLNLSLGQDYRLAR